MPSMPNLYLRGAARAKQQSASAGAQVAQAGRPKQHHYTLSGGSCLAALSNFDQTSLEMLFDQLSDVDGLVKSVDSIVTISEPVFVTSSNTVCDIPMPKVVDKVKATLNANALTHL